MAEQFTQGTMIIDGVEVGVSGRGVSRVTNGTYALDTVLTMPKYCGLTVEEVIDQDPQYLTWCLKNIRNFKLCKDSEYLLIDALKSSQTE